jgi:hypothetical protein
MLHKHHIVPRHSGGTDNVDNIFYLSVIQHALAHRNRAILLNNSNDWIAWLALSSSIGKEEARIRAHRIVMIGHKFNIGRKANQQEIDNKGLAWQRNPQRKQDQIKRMKEDNPSFRPEVLLKLRKPKTTEHCSNISKGKKGKRSGPIVKCPHCEVLSTKSIMMRWHFDKCRYKI